MRVLFACLAALALSLPSAAQPGVSGASVFTPVPASIGARGGLTPQDSACTYDVCALRVEPGFGGTRLLRGADGQAVTTLGLFGGSVQNAVRGSERALPHARTYDRASTSGFIMTGIGTAILVGSPVFLQGRLGTGEPGTAGFGTAGTAALAGLALMVYGGLESLSAQRALSRAVWEYNRDLRR